MEVFRAIHQRYLNFDGIYLLHPNLQNELLWKMYTDFRISKQMTVNINVSDSTRWLENGLRTTVLNGVVSENFFGYIEKICSSELTDLVDRVASLDAKIDRLNLLNSRRISMTRFIQPLIRF
jgi:hypothetical protein